MGGRVGWRCGWVCLHASEKTCFCLAGMQTGQQPRAEIITLAVAVAVNTGLALPGTTGSKSYSQTNLVCLRLHSLQFFGHGLELWWGLALSQCSAA